MLRPLSALLFGVKRMGVQRRHVPQHLSGPHPGPSAARLQHDADLRPETFPAYDLGVITASSVKSRFWLTSTRMSWVTAL